MNPVVYNLSEEQKLKYNKSHRHLAFELRNMPNCKQSPVTDLYSLGRVFKVIGYCVNDQGLKDLGSLMMNKQPHKRPCLSNVAKNLKSCT